MTELLGVLFLLVWLAAGLAMAKVCAINGRDDEPALPVARIAVICGRCKAVLCEVDTREQAVLEDELHHMVQHQEGRLAWTS